MIRILGHRGGRDLWPENSLQGFRNAIQLGVDCVEFDLHLSADDVLMVMHDATLERTTHGSGLVRRQTAAELGKVRLKDSTETVPTFEQTLDVFEGNTTELYVEIKTDAVGDRYPGIERMVLDAVERRGMAGRTTIVSFVPESLEDARAIAPGIAVVCPVFKQSTQMLGGLDAQIARLERIPGCLMSFERTLLAAARERLLARIPRRQFLVGITNEPAELDWWAQQDVYQIGSDRPDLALAARKRYLP